MRCSKCGKDLDSGASFCPFCGEKAPGVAAGEDKPIYEAEIKGLIRSGRLIVYRDRTEFVMSRVQKMVFRYDSLAAVRKGLDRINFIMEDGRTESCAMGIKVLSKAFFTIEQASRPYLEERNRRLRSEGIRYSFPSGRSGLSGILNSGLLNVLDDRCEFVVPSGKNEVIFYRDMKSVRVSSVGTLEFNSYDCVKRSFSIDRELRDELAAFFQEALPPFVEARKAELLERGIYFSFINRQNFTKYALDIYADRLVYSSDMGPEDTVDFRDIRAVQVFDGTLRTAMTDGTAKSFLIDREAQNEVLAFMETAIAPHVEKRTVGFDVCFGSNERLEVNPERGVFHVLRMGGREITEEYVLADLVKAEAAEKKALRERVSALFTGRNSETTPRVGDERIAEVGVTLTVRTEEGAVEVPVCLAAFSIGVSRTGPEYGRCMEDLSRFFGFLAEKCPGCECVPLPPVTAGTPEAPAAAPPAESDAIENVEQEEPPAEPEESDSGQFGALIRGISDYVEHCGTPMTVAIQGDWETGGGSFMRMIYNKLGDGRQGSVFWLSTWQFTQFDLWDQLPLLLADKLIDLLGGSVNMEVKARAKMLAQGFIGIASGIISQGTTDGQKVNDAFFKDNLANSLEQKLKLFQDLVRRRAVDGKVIFFVDDLNRLAPVKVVELLDTMRCFFDCPGCIFMVAADRETVLRGRRELDGPDYTDEKAEAYFNKLFRTVFRVPRESFDIRKYVAESLERVNICGIDEVELSHYAELSRLSAGSDPKALERLFNSFMLLRSVAGEDAFAGHSGQLFLFATVCMQNRFPGAYRCMVRRKDRITPEFLTSLASGSDIEEEAGLGGSDQQDFRAFGAELCASVNTDGVGGISEQECRVFADALSVSAITSLN